jgi:hypothetical protein
MADHLIATKLADFNETEYKQFAMREGDRWSFSLPYSEMQNLDDTLLELGYVLGVDTKFLEPHGEIILGKLIPKQ